MRGISSILVSAAILVSLGGCDKRQQTDRIDAEMARAEQEGLIIEGYQDVEGIKRAVERFAVEMNDSNAKIDAELRGAMDAREAAEFAKMAREMALANLAIESIEFVPGLSGPKGSDPEDVIRGLGSIDDWGGAPENDYVAGFPSLGSLTGQDAGGGRSWPRPAHDENGRRIGTTFMVDTENGRVGGYVSLDGRHFGTASEYRNSDGMVQREEKYLLDGRFHSSRVTTYDTANDVVVRVTKFPGRDPIKEEVPMEDADREHAAGVGSDDADDEVLPNPYTGVQPSDGLGGGRFCPLTLDVCRRAMDRALKSREKVQVGVILINPADPDDVPTAPRLKYETGGLVINPSPDAGVNTSRDPRTFRMRLPVWVLPPKPVLGGNNEVTPPGN